jgi:hypothetical protein
LGASAETALPVSGIQYRTVLRPNLINIAHLDIGCGARDALNPIEDPAARLSGYTNNGVRACPLSVR